MKFTAVTILFLFVFGTACLGQAINKDLADMVQAEHDFSATAVKEGFRDSFIKYFADDGIGFSPHPEKTREKLQKTPPQTGPRAIIFRWSTMTGDMSLAGDLGYSTGPVIYEDQTPAKRPPRHGIIFSVWQKQADGTWRVVVDMGCSTPQPVAAVDSAVTPANRKGAANKKEASNVSGPDYLDVDAEFSAAIAKDGMTAAYGKYLNEDFRFHRNEIMPITDKSSLDAYLEKLGKKFEYKTMGGKIAASKDLAFTYGSVNDQSTVTGYYVHMWRKDAKGRWRLVADVMNPLAR